MRLVIESDGNRYALAEDIENLSMGPIEDPISPAAAMMIGAMFRMIEDIQARKVEPRERGHITIARPNPFHET